MNKYHPGQRIGSLIIVGITDKKGKGLYRNSIYRLKCDCGKIIERPSYHFQNGKLQNCGCYRKNYKHGHAGKTVSREYKAWKAIKARCYNSQAVDYCRYGGKGITVSGEWINDFMRFYKDLGPCPHGHTIERIDNKKGYEQGNCRWATRKEQNSNKKNNIYLMYQGEKYSLRDLAEKVNVLYRTLYSRIRRGLPLGNGIIILENESRAFCHRSGKTFDKVLTAG